MILARIEIAKPGLSIWIDDQKYEFPAVVPTLDLVEKLFRHLNEPCQITAVERSYCRACGWAWGIRLQFQSVDWIFLGLEDRELNDEIKMEIVIHD